MFTGLVENTGTIASLSQEVGATRLTVHLPSSMAERLTEGASIAVNGVCLTALAISATHFSADLARETLARTTLGSLPVGRLVNLELPTPAGSPLGGHVVQGHVDGVAQLLSLEPVNPDSVEHTDWVLRALLPTSLAGGVLAQGSITLDGISLTVAEVSATADGVELRIAIIPHTYAVTHLHALAAGALLNVETDVLARYAAYHHKATSAAAAPIGLAYLLRRGY